MLLRALVASSSLLSLSFASACGGPSVELVDETLNVVHVSPHHGAVDVARDSSVVIGFSTAVDLEAVAEHLSLVQEDDGGDTKPVGTRVFLEEGGTVVTMVPTNVLDAGTLHSVVIVEGLEASSGALLPAPLRSEFVTRR